MIEAKLATKIAIIESAIELLVTNHNNDEPMFLCIRIDDAFENMNLDDNMLLDDLHEEFQTFARDESGKLPSWWGVDMFDPYEPRLQLITSFLQRLKAAQ